MCRSGIDLSVLLCSVVLNHSYQFFPSLSNSVIFCLGSSQLSTCDGKSSTNYTSCTYDNVRCILAKDCKVGSFMAVVSSISSTVQKLLSAIFTIIICDCYLLGYQLQLLSVQQATCSSV